MKKRMVTAVLTFLAATVGFQTSIPAGSAPIRPRIESAQLQYASSPAPLSSGFIEQMYPPTPGGRNTWSATISSPASTGSYLDARMDPVIFDTGSGLSLTLPGGETITAGTTYTPLTQPGVSAQFGFDLKGVCEFLDPDSFIHVDQYAVNGAGTVTSFAIRFQCAGNILAPGFWSGTMAYNAVPTTPHQGYYLMQQSGALTGFGNDRFLSYLGDLSASQLARPVVGMATTPDDAGYWMVSSDGGVFAFGDARFLGSMGGIPLNRPIVGMARTADGAGYWLVASDGGIFAFGDASFLGSMGGSPLNRPIVGVSASASGGYWLVASDGGVFSFGAATFYGSTGAVRLNRPVVGIAPTLDGEGYWMVASDGGVFTFGDAVFHGSTGALTLQAPITEMLPAPDDSGYWLSASDGGVFAFATPFLGSLGGTGITNIAGIAT